MMGALSPVVYLSWREACAIDFDDIGFVHPPEDEEEYRSTDYQEENLELVHIIPKPAPEISDLSTVDAKVQSYIDHCVASGSDPRARHGFYVKIEELLNQAQDEGLISYKQEVDSLWLKYDLWARTAYDCLQDKKTQELEELANDISKCAPKPPACTPFNKRKCRIRFFRNSRWGSKGIKRNGSPTVLRKIRLANQVLYEFLLKAHENGWNLRDNLTMRRQFFDRFPHFIDKEHQNFMDFYWNALFHRNLSYYQRTQEIQLEIEEKRKKEKTKKPRKNLVLKVRRLIGVDKTVPISHRKLDVDRIVRKAINDSILLAKEPRASHHFYWTAYLALVAKQMEVGSKGKILKDATKDEYWRKWDTWADEAWEARSPLLIEEDPEEKFYSDVKRLATGAKRELTSYPGPEGCMIVETKLLRNKKRKRFLQVLEEGLASVLGRAGRVPVSKTLGLRRRFLNCYVGYAPKIFEESEVDEFWRRLGLGLKEKCGKEVQIVVEQGTDDGLEEEDEDDEDWEWEEPVEDGEEYLSEEEKGKWMGETVVKCEEEEEKSEIVELGDVVIKEEVDSS